MEELLTWAFEAFKTLAAYGPLGMAGALLMIAVRLLQLPSIQAVLPDRVRWVNLPPLAKVFVPVGGSLLAALLAIVGGASAPLSISLALAAAGLSIGGHHATKALGEALYMGALKKDAQYVPSPLRDKMSIVVPFPRVEPVVFAKAP